MPKAMVMAAGLGLRMRPLSDLPKPLIPIAGKPLIDHALDWLAASGVTEAVVNTHYRADLVRGHLASRNAPRILFSQEDVLLETGGGICKALPLLGGEPFFSINSDTMCLDGRTPALHRLHKQWDSRTMDALLLLQPVETATGYEGKGDFFLHPDGILERRGEKPKAPYVFTGVQILHPRLFAGAPSGPFSLNLLYDRAMQAGNAPRIRGLVHDGHWLHVGDPEGVRKAEAFLTAA